MNIWARWRRRDAGTRREHGPDAASPASLLEFEVWHSQFLSVIDEAATMAACAAQPNIAAAGLSLAQVRPATQEIADISGWGLQRWPENPMYIEGVRRLFETTQAVLSMSIETGETPYDEQHQELENSWRTSTLVLMNQLAELRSNFMAGMERAGRPVGDEWRGA